LKNNIEDDVDAHMPENAEDEAKPTAEGDDN